MCCANWTALSVKGINIAWQFFGNNFWIRFGKNNPDFVQSLQQHLLFSTSSMTCYNLFWCFYQYQELIQECSIERVPTLFKKKGWQPVSAKTKGCAPVSEKSNKKGVHGGAPSLSPPRAHTYLHFCMFHGVSLLNKVMKYNLSICPTGFCCAYLIFISNNLASVIKGSHMFHWISVMLPPLAVLCLLRHLQKLAIFR